MNKKKRKINWIKGEDKNGKCIHGKYEVWAQVCCNHFEGTIVLTVKELTVYIINIKKMIAETSCSQKCKFKFHWWTGFIYKFSNFVDIINLNSA